MTTVKSYEDKKVKRKVVRNSIEVKKQLIYCHEAGVRVIELAAMFKMPKSTVCTILKNKEAIKAANVAQGISTLSNRRTKFMDEVETKLLFWIKEKILAGEAISGRIICQKAKLLHSEFIEKDLPGNSADEFKASKGWFERFKRRIGLYNYSNNKNFSLSSPLRLSSISPEHSTQVNL